MAVLLAALSMALENPKDYYLVLGISRTEDAKGIRRAFRSLAKRVHPDKMGPEGAPLFKDIVEAYQVLSDSEQRRDYDRSLTRAEKLKEKRFRRSRAAEAEPFRFVPHSGIEGFPVEAYSLHELFGSLLPDFFSFETPGQDLFGDVNLEAILSPHEAAEGVTAEIGVGGDTVRIRIPPGVRDGSVLEAPFISGSNGADLRKALLPAFRWPPGSSG